MTWSTYLSTSCLCICLAVVVDSIPISSVDEEWSLNREVAKRIEASYKRAAVISSVFGRRPIGLKKGSGPVQNMINYRPARAFNFKNCYFSPIQCVLMDKY
uniref:Uncharacterized protein n=1 Tax=Plectus sambesii TaxID=2011161 RepID=A0A914W2H2_9BILA